jgi:hypothetical protein
MVLEALETAAVAAVKQPVRRSFGRALGVDTVSDWRRP